VNVSLPNIATHATPAKTLPGTGTISGKFSNIFAEAQDTADASLPDVLSGGSYIEKKMSAKGESKSDKSSAKPSSAQPTTSIPKPATVIPPAAAEGKLALTSLTPPALPIASPEDFDTLGFSKADSDSPHGPPFQATLKESGIAATSALSAASGAAVSGQLETKKIDSLNPSADVQQTTASVLNGSAAGIAPAGDNIQRPVVAFANPPASATPNGKPATAGTKTVSNDAARGTISTSNKSQTASLFPASRTESLTPTAPVKQDAPKAQPEKATAPASAETRTSETHKKALEGLSNETSVITKGNSAVPGAVLAGNSGALSGTTDAMATPLPSASAQLSVPGTLSPSANNSSFTTNSSSHLPTAATEDTLVATESAAGSATSPLNVARLVTAAERSELRVGLRTGEFGNVDIRTSLARNQFTAEISVERGELGRALAAELPSLQHRLTAQHLPAADITVQNHSGGGSSDFQQAPRQGSYASPNSASSESQQDDSILAALPAEVMGATARLDIHM
jgi:flagellar hook-length control protein FliK